MKPMEKESITTWMVPNTKENGKMTGKAEWVLNNGQTVLATRGNLVEVKRKEQEYLSGQMDLFIMVALKIT
jgi:hypothetical protein